MARRVAVCVGVNKYIDPDDDLEYARPDAEAVANTLAAPPFNFDVVRLMDKDATRRNVLKALADTRESDAEQVLFYFAGHGATSPTGTYLVAHDTEFIEDGIDTNAVARSLDAQESSTTKTLVILDCCHAGGAAARRGSSTRPASNEDISAAFTTSNSSRAVMAACLPDEKSWEDADFGHGIFTYYLLEALAGSAVDDHGNLSVAGIYRYVCVPFESDTRQTPVFRGDLYGDLILASGLEPLLGAPSSARVDRDQILDQARSLLDSYTRRPGLTRAERLESGHADSCRALEPVVLWFEKQLTRNEKFSSDDEFMALYHAAWSEAAHLAHLAKGLTLPEGKATAFLGEGTFGAVWSVERPEGRSAYKVYHPTEMRNREKLTRFRQGYDAMRQLNHPNIVKVQAYTNCPLGFFMDYVDGPNLRDRGIATTGDPLEVLELLIKVAEALRHAHSKNVIHRDIKPENIVIGYDSKTGEYEPFVTDFDLAWFSTATQLTDQAIGALSYAAPEQLNLRKVAEARRPTVDVYAFGQLCYFCVLDSHPVPVDFTGNQRRLDSSLRTWGDPAASNAFLELYEVCSKTDPSQRLGDFQGILDRLHQCKDMLLSASRDDAISEERLLSSIAYRLSGTENHSFPTRSGQTQIELKITEHPRKRDEYQIEARFRPLQKFNVAGKPMAARRAEINRQVSAVVSAVSWASFRAGHDVGFEIFIDLRKISLKYGTIGPCYGVLDQVVQAFER